MQKLEIAYTGDVHYNLSPAELIEHAIRRGEGRLASNGALVCETVPYTGRSPKDRYIVEEPTTQGDIDWGAVNVPFPPDLFDEVYKRVIAYLQNREVYVTDCYAGANPRYRMPVRFVTELAWHALFVKQLLLRPSASDLEQHVPEFTIINACNFRAFPEVDGTRSEAFVIINFARRLILIGGTRYAGEMKKSVFTVLNYLLPKRGILPMHCSANVGPQGDVALFFGLSGTGKTSLSADPSRKLIGDDEHGWADDGVFNFEGGCYAKCINLSRDNEPQIWDAIRYGSVLENVVLNPATRAPEYADDALTENTRAAYPIEFIDGAVIPSQGPHPSTVLFLTCDAFGVLPPISKLTKEQAMYHFLLGYTARVAGTEAGVKEPQPVFSACFGAPFLPRSANEYAQMLGERIAKHKSQVWLVNTGWTGGPYGIGNRISIQYTRQMVNAAISGELDEGEFHKDPVFGLMVPRHVPDVPPKLLMPGDVWPDQRDYDRKAREVDGMFASAAKAAKIALPV
ncbi:MAG: phosphoenolpyruvate carboxykinase [ATP] 1 [Fimbriimonadales bacterium]